MTTPEQPAERLSRPPEPRTGAGEPGLRWEGDGALGGGPPAPRWGGEGERGAPQVAPPPQAEQPRGSWWRNRESVVLDGLALAPLHRRAFAWVIDRSIKLLIFSLVITFAGIDLSAPLAPAMLLAWQAFSGGYDWIFFTPGWSPGKRMLGIRIVRVEDGSEPGPRRALLRVAGTMLSETAFGLGFMWAIWDRRRQTWQDKLGRTYVVMAPRKPRE